MMATVLVVEDEERIRDLVRSYLERAGLEVLSTGSGAHAIELARSTTPDLLVLDLRLPDVPGEVVASEIRRFLPVPTLMLTAKSSEQDRIRGLELGADDYVTKPFSPRELVIDADRRGVQVRGETVELTPTEWGILVSLARVPGRVYSRYELINKVRGFEFEGYERTIDSHVKNLRRKVERDSRQPQIVETVLGAGYRLRLTPDG